MAKDYDIRRHQELLDYLQPVGVVVSPLALQKAQVLADRNTVHEQGLLRKCLDEVTPEGSDKKQKAVLDLPRLLTDVLGWSLEDLVGVDQDDPLPASLEIVLPEYGETLRPTWAVKNPDMEEEGESPWSMLIQVIDPGQDLDKAAKKRDRGWHASPHSKFERLLRETRIPIGLLSNGTLIRLVYAPHGETSGFMTFPVGFMSEVAGRPVFSGFFMLLEADRLFNVEKDRSLPAILEESRKYQNQVSTKLAEQVLRALYEFLRGFQAAHELSRGELLSEVLEKKPNHVYEGLLTVMMRLVFLLYAEERGLVSDDPIYLQHYSVKGLFERLRDDANRHGDTMDQRYGAWAQLLSLFRLVYDGASHAGLHLPARHGHLFDPDRFNFFEGRPYGVKSVPGERIIPPKVSDGVVWRVLQDLLILDGARLSYRGLDVEQIGSVYETMMGFNLHVAKGRSIVVKSPKRHGAPVTLNLDALLALDSKKRKKYFKEKTGRDITGKREKAVKEAKTPEGVAAAIEGPVTRRKASARARGMMSPVARGIVPKGDMILQPSEERRRTGSHYTPRELTEPIVRTTLRPILEQIGEKPEPEQILDLKVCDPAMGSGAFLVEACRQLAEKLVDAWHVHDRVPEDIPPDEDEQIFARRLVAQRCLYGVDKNHVAVDLAKVSLWLITLARDHSLTFLDHALRHGDSLVGLTKNQIEAFDLDPSKSILHGHEVREPLERLSDLREKIRNADESTSDAELRDLWDEAQKELRKIRFLGDLIAAAFFEGSKPKEREKKLSEYANAVLCGEAERFRCQLEEWRHAEKPLVPFHWEVEFPEVFDLVNPGFNALVGNPPFLGGTQISQQYGMSYFQWLTMSFRDCRHHCDLVAYFFRCAYSNLRNGGCLGFIATNTISQGDTREGGLRVLINDGGEIYHATRRFKWPGLAAVVVSVVHVSKNHCVRDKLLDEILVPGISAYLVKGSISESPARLHGNPYFSLGSKIYGQGFLFADNNPHCTAIVEREKLLAAHPDWEDRIPPYIGGEEINSDSRHRSRRFVICLSDVQDEGELNQWPELKSIVEQKVKPERLRLGSNPNNVPLKRRWWAFQAHRPELYAAMESNERVLATSSVSKHRAFAFVPSTVLLSHNVTVITIDTYSSFTVLQSRLHELWAVFFSSSLEDRSGYRPSDCLETFPFPENWQNHAVLEGAGKVYYEFRADLMVRNNEGLTITYNRFHDLLEDDSDILKLRELHAAMDSAVLDAYGWTDISTECDFTLDYEIDEEEWGKKKKPYRYGWPEEVHDEVLARLLDLNQKRAEEQRLAGLQIGAKRKGKGKRKRAGRKKKDEDKTVTLFDELNA